MQDRHDESGVTLIEVLVAFTILGIVMAGLAATTINALNLSRNNANRVIAANVAASEIERIRSLPFERLDDREDESDTTGPEFLGEHTRDIVVDGQSFQVDRTIEWSTLEAEDGVCSATTGPGDQNVLAVTVEVTWSRMFGVRPVRSETTISPPIGVYQPNTGTLAVNVVDDSVTPQIGVENALVTVTGPEPLTNPVGGTPALTDDDGCVVLTGIGSGSYTVEVVKDGYLDLNGDRPTVHHPVTVEVRSRTDHRVELYPTGHLAVQIAARAGDLTPNALPRYATPNDGPTLAIGEYDDTTETWTYGDSLSREVSVGTYTVAAGPCGVGGYTSSSFSVAPGPAATPTVGEARLASVNVDWVAGTISTTDPFELTAQWQGTCPGEDEPTLDLGTITPGEPVSVALPWTGVDARWRIEAVNPVTGQAVNAVDVGGDGSHRPQLIPGGVGDWEADASLVPTVYLELPPDVCSPIAPTYVGSTSRVFSSTGYASANQTIELPTGTAGDDLVVFTASTQVTDAVNWAPTGGGWELVAEDSGIAVWTREASGLGGSIQFTRPQYGFFFWQFSRPGVVNVASFRDVTMASPVRDRSVSSGNNSVSSLDFQAEPIPADEHGLLFHAATIDANREQTAWTPSPGSHAAFNGGGGLGSFSAHSHVTLWDVHGPGPANTGPTTIGWTGSGARASGHQLLFEAARCDL